MTARWLPQPILTVVIAAVWIALANQLSVASVLMGFLVGIAIPWFTSRYWPDAPTLRRPTRIIVYALIVVWDIIVSNVQVAYWVLLRRGDSLRSRFVVVPLDLHVPEAVAVLAGTITMTPGTVSADLASDGSAILVHCLETEDPDAVVRQIKQRYERRLMEIFS